MIDYTGLTSTTYNSISMGELLAFTVNKSASASAFGVGSRIRAYADVSHWVEGSVIYYSGTTLHLDPDAVSGTGEGFSSWTFSLTGAAGVAGPAGPTGAAGPVGPAGATGATGAAGGVVCCIKGGSSVSLGGTGVSILGGTVNAWTFASGHTVRLYASGNFQNYSNTGATITLYMGSTAVGTLTLSGLTTSTSYGLRIEIDAVSVGGTLAGVIRAEYGSSTVPYLNARAAFSTYFGVPSQVLGLTMSTMSTGTYTPAMALATYI